MPFTPRDTTGVPYLSLGEISEELRVDMKTVRGWIDAGELPVYVLGPKSIRVARADYEQFLADRYRPAGGITKIRPNETDADGDIRSRCSSPESEVQQSGLAS